jgi:hypothetical protein
VAGFTPQKSLKTACLPDQIYRASVAVINKVTAAKAGPRGSLKARQTTWQVV